MSLKILVVDDSPTDNEALSIMLKNAGFAVLNAFDGESGVEMAKAENPNLVLMDVVMPGINGFQACKMITKNDQTKHIPVIICSNKHQDADKAWGEKNGAKFYFVKPANEDDLISKIKELTQTL